MPKEVVRGAAVAFRLTAELSVLVMECSLVDATKANFSVPKLLGLQEISPPSFELFHVVLVCGFPVQVKLVWSWSGERPL